MTLHDLLAAEQQAVKTIIGAGYESWSADQLAKRFSELHQEFVTLNADLQIYLKKRNLSTAAKRAARDIVARRMGTLLTCEDVLHQRLYAARLKETKAAKAATNELA